MQVSTCFLSLAKSSMIVRVVFHRSETVLMFQYNIMGIKIIHYVTTCYMF